jgi:hypothetical protein
MSSDGLQATFLSPNTKYDAEQKATNCYTPVIDYISCCQ